MLAGLLDPAGTSGPVVVSAVAGLAGVGKTSLAVQAGTLPSGRAGLAAGCCSLTCTAMTRRQCAGARRYCKR